ncbi:MAG: hypothetical protein MUP14_01890 [Dehalococcoidia bacterium]|nr:hypothetical protein [Dehalococcoidia bacterium]
MRTWQELTCHEQATVQMGKGGALTYAPEGDDDAPEGDDLTRALLGLLVAHLRGHMEKTELRQGLEALLAPRARRQRCGW